MIDFRAPYVLGAVVDEGALIIGHVLQDWHFITDSVDIGNRATVGARAFVHCGNDIGDGSTLCSLSKVLVGTIPPQEVWHGTPAKPAQAAFMQRARTSPC